jgi:molecular chaperone GrpE
MSNGETTEQAPTSGSQRGSSPGDATTSGVPAEELIPEEEEETRAPSELEVLQGETALLEQQLQQMRDRYIRAVADLDNARKRARQAIGEARQQAIAGILQELLPLLDNFERALESSAPGANAPAEMRAVYDGIELIYRQLKQVLERRGVKPIEALGQPFDPHLHEAVVQVPAGKEHPEGTVALEMQRGYTCGDQVLRHSRVGVAVREAGSGKAAS